MGSGTKLAIGADCGKIPHLYITEAIYQFDHCLLLVWVVLLLIRRNSSGGNLEKDIDVE